jgi:hypothetical protein
VGSIEKGDETMYLLNCLKADVAAEVKQKGGFGGGAK